MKKYKLHVVWGVIAVIALAGGFFWGKNMAVAGVAQNRNRAFVGPGTGAPGGFGGRGGAGGGGFVAGTVTAIDANSITLQLPNGNSENVFYSSSTSVVVPQTASISAIQSGAMVMIGGTQNTDGSMTATTIQVRKN